MTAIEQGRLTGTLSRMPLFILAGSHGSLHWALAIFYVVLPFIKTEFGLNYTETGLLASIVHGSAFIANFPSGMIVDITGRRRACQIVATALAAVGLMGVGWSTSYWMVAGFVSIVAMMNTLWHPAAISFLSASYAERRGLALSFHTIGASIGDAAAPVAAGLFIAAFGWNGATMAGAAVPLIASILLFFVFVAPQEPSAQKPPSRGGTKLYLSGMRQLISDAQVWKVLIMSGFRGTSQAGLRTFLPLYFVAAFSDDPYWLGVIVMVLQVGGAVATPFAGALSDRIGRKPILMVGFVGSCVVIFALPSIGSLWLLIVAVGLAGCFIFSVRPVIQSWALDMTPPQLGGSMVSMQFGTQSAFAMTVPLTGGLIADAWGIEYVFYALGAAIIVACGIATTIREKPVQTA
ncbi:MAG: MFS transporter [Proteobacteria bacterium]|nr:MFS transporter [Pseudomonadota bacterium]